MNPLNPEDRYLLLGQGGTISAVNGGAAFWQLPPQTLDEYGHSWLVTEYLFTENWASWEKHPHGDEVVYLLEGAMDLILEREAREDVIELREKGAFIVPRGTWHTARIHAPSRALFMTLGRGTEHRPCNNAEEAT